MKSVEPSRNYSEIVNQNQTFLVAVIDEVNADFKVIEQVLVLGVLERQGHPHELQTMIGILERLERASRAASLAGACSRSPPICKEHQYGGEV